MAKRALTSVKDPLGPLEFIVTLATSLYVFAAIAFLIARLAGLHVFFGTFGQSDPCVDVPQTNLMINGTTHNTQIDNLKQGWHEGIPKTFSICTNQMANSDQWLTSTPALLNFLWSLGFLLLTLRVLRYARRHGLFVSGVARRVSHLGRFIVIGHLFVVIASSLASATATSHMVPDYNILSAAFAYSSFSWPILIGGLAVVSFGRIMQQTVPMREEIDATV